MTKTLEEKLKSFKKELIETLNKTELTINEYESYCYNLLKKNNIIDEKDYKTANDTSKDLLFKDPIDIKFGLKNDIYVTIKNNELKNDKYKKDIENFEKLINLAKEYTTNIDTTKITKHEYNQLLRDYLINKPEMKELSVIKQLINCYGIAKLIDSDYKFKKEKETHKQNEINKILNKI